MVVPLSREETTPVGRAGFARRADPRWGSALDASRRAGLVTLARNRRRTTPRRRPGPARLAADWLHGPRRPRQQGAKRVPADPRSSSQCSSAGKSPAQTSSRRLLRVRAPAECPQCPPVAELAPFGGRQPSRGMDLRFSLSLVGSCERARDDGIVGMVEGPPGKSHRGGTRSFALYYGKEGSTMLFQLLYYPGVRHFLSGKYDIAKRFMRA